MRQSLTFIQIVKLLLRHRKLADARSFGSIENKFARFMIYLSVGFVFIYLMGLSIPFAMIANESRSMTSAELLCQIFPLLLAADFGFRFIGQQTPSQVVRPYCLLPLPRYACIDTFIASSILTWGNVVWMAFILPYIIMSMVFSYGLLTSAIATISALLLIAANSQWYAIVRTLVNDNYIWWCLPVTVYTAMASPLFIGHDAGLENYMATYAYFGGLVDRHNPLAVLALLAVLAALVATNRKIQFIYVQRELTHTEKKEEVKVVNKYHFLDRYGEIGTLLQLEIKLLTRNKNPRKAFFAGIGTMLLISLIIIFSDIYDNVAMTNFWGLYNFVLLGATILVRIMGYEGNYIDSLLVRRENILTLLRAKYIFYSILLVLPFTLMLPVVISGKWSLFMLVSYMAYTMGAQYFMIFQMAVYNKQSIPLNEKITGKGGLDGNYTQMLVMAAIFIVPNALATILQTVLGDKAAYSTMLVIGLLFVLTNKLWLRNLYKRMMKRKYQNLESFISTR